MSLLTLSNISAKHHQNVYVYVKIIASQMCMFMRHSVYIMVRKCHLSMTAAEALIMTSATLPHTTGRTVAASNHIQASLHVTRRQASIAIAIVLTCEALSIAGTPASIVSTFWWTDASWCHCQSTTNTEETRLLQLTWFIIIHTKTTTLSASYWQNITTDHSVVMHTVFVIFLFCSGSVW